MDFPPSPQELGGLKSRLAADAGDASARQALVDWYRRNGHEDQAGRYAVAIDGLATEHEVRAYAAMLRGLGADARRMHALSRLPDDAPTTERVQQQLDAASSKLPHTRIVDIVAWVTWFLFVLIVISGLITTFVLAFHGDAQVQEAAVTISIISLSSLALACGISAVALATEKMRIAATVFGVLFFAALTVKLLLLDR